jgi:hypothetical protein
MDRRVSIWLVDSSRRCLNKRTELVPTCPLWSEHMVSWSLCKYELGSNFHQWRQAIIQHNSLGQIWASWLSGSDFFACVRLMILSTGLCAIVVIFALCVLQNSITIRNWNKTILWKNKLKLKECIPGTLKRIPSQNYLILVFLFLCLWYSTV